MKIQTLKATYKTLNKGNLAIEQDVWTIETEQAKKFLQYLKKEHSFTSGSWENFNIIKPIRSAIRSKKNEVKIYSSGFSTTSVYNLLENSGFIITYQ